MRRWFWVVLLVLLVAGGAAWLFKSSPRSGRPLASSKGVRAAGPMPVAVAVAKARRSDIPVYLDGLGTVGAFYTVTVRSRIDGALDKVYFQEGQYVQVGDLLAEIDPRPFQVELDQAEGQLARDEALLANARLDVERYRLLVSQDAIPRQQLDTQLATVKQFEGVVKTDQANVDNARLQISYCRITAPIDGRVGLRQVDPGNMVRSGDPNGLVVITQLQPIAVFFTLPEDDLFQVLAKIRNGTRLRTEAFNRDRSQRLATGVLTTVDNQIDPTTGTSRLKAVFENRDGALYPNQFVNIRLLVEVLRRQVVVPSVAIQRGAQGPYVYVITSDNTAEFRPVSPGITEANDTAVLKGLDAGELVVVDGADKLQPGSRVATRGGPAAPGAGSAAAPIRQAARPARNSGATRDAGPSADDGPGTRGQQR